MKSNFSQVFSNGNQWNQIAKRSGEFPLNDETLKKCLKTFDELFEDLENNASPGTQRVCNLTDRFKEKFHDVPPHCMSILDKIFQENERQLELKTGWNKR